MQPFKYLHIFKDVVPNTMEWKWKQQGRKEYNAAFTSHTHRHTHAHSAKNVSKINITVFPSVMSQLECYKFFSAIQVYFLCN